MKIRIEQRSVYHKIAVVEIEVDETEYEHYRLDNDNDASMDDYLIDNEHLWCNKVDEKISKAEYNFGFGCDNDASKYHGTNFNEQDSESETRWVWEEEKIGGHL